MSAPYIIAMQGATIINSGELITLRAATAFTSRGSLLEVLRMKASQRSTTTSAQLGMRWGLKASAFGTFTATTPVPTVLGAAASAITGSTSNAAASAGTAASANGAGTLTVMDQEEFNNLTGFLWIPTPEERIIIGPDQSFVMQLQGSPSALTLWTASVLFRELN